MEKKLLREMVVLSRIKKLNIIINKL